MSLCHCSILEYGLFTLSLDVTLAFSFMIFYLLFQVLWSVPIPLDIPRNLAFGHRLFTCWYILLLFQLVTLLIMCWIIKSLDSCFSHSWGCVFFVTNSCFKRNVRDTKNRKNRVWRITCTPSKLFFHVTFMQHEQALFFLGIFLLLIDFKKIIKICKILSPAVVVVHSEWCQVINLQIMQIFIYENIHLQNSQN